MTRADGSDPGQEEMWNGGGGRGWVAAQASLDRLFSPIEKLLVEEVRAARPRDVLDVGCGTGGTTLAIARALGTDGGCTGLDISGPMITAARARATGSGLPVHFIRADAQRYRFEPAHYDAVASRFGVMFFDDPVEAFANLRGATRAGGGLRFVAWRSPAENAFMTTAERAARPLVDLPARVPDEPGQFGLADGGRVRAILDESGWNDIDVEPLDVAFSMPEHELIPYLTTLGPLGRALADVDPATRSRVIARVRPAFDRYIEGDDVLFSAACWLVRAHA